MFMLPARTVTQPKPVSVLCQFLQADETVETVCLQLPFYPFDSVHAILFFLYYCSFVTVQTTEHMETGSLHV
jgi:hypothetical protein